jgi:phosphatidylinositol 3-kinase
LERLVNKYERGQIHHVDWLDRLAFSAMEKAKEKECERNANLYPSLVVELCSFEHRVVFQVNILTFLCIYLCNGTELFFFL